MGSWGPIISFPSTLFCDIMLITCNQQWWKYLHIRKNLQKLQIRTSYFSLRVSCLVFISTPWSVCICQHSANLTQNGCIGGYVSYISITMMLKVINSPLLISGALPAVGWLGGWETQEPSFLGLKFILQLTLTPSQVKEEEPSHQDHCSSWPTSFQHPSWQVQNFPLSNPLRQKGTEAQEGEEIYCFPFILVIMCSSENVKATVIICLLCSRLCNIQRRTKGKVALTAFHKITKHNPNLRAFAPTVLQPEMLFQKSPWLTASLLAGLGSNAPFSGRPFLTIRLSIATTLSAKPHLPLIYFSP